ncbi:MAG: hypothetical protein WBK91_02915 [Alphaproteobacteria bacterium]
MTRNQNLKTMEIANNICVGDCCISAVRRAYTGMIDCGQPEPAAYDAALTVFSWHHPEIAPYEAETLVRGWVSEQFVH